MKTIFLSLFEGVEAKNLLRTQVVPTLLSRGDVRVILLMKSRERIELYEREFSDPRLIYEVMPYDRRPGRGLDRLFGYLKFLLLDTETTRIRRRIAYEEGGRWLSFAVAGAASRLLARPSVRALVRALDYRLILPKAELQSAFEKWRPDLVVLAHLFEEPEIDILRAARRRGIATVGIVNSWDKVTARAIMRLLPDRAIVFNDIVKRDLARHDDMPVDRIAVSGMPQYDAYARPPGMSRAQFFADKSIPADHKLIVFAPFGRSFNNSMWEAIDLLEKLRSAGEFGEQVSILVRFQPNDFVEEGELRKRPWLLADYPGVRFTADRGIDWDMGKEEIDRLAATLAHLDVLVCYASSITVDAFYFDKPVVNIGFELRSGEPASKQPTRHYAFEHYKQVLSRGAVSLALSPEELARAVRGYLADPTLRHAERRQVLLEQAQYLDGASGERMGRYILESLD